MRSIHFNMIPVIGLMSGTSIDGIDASLVYTNGKELERTNFNTITPYSKDLKHILLMAMENPKKFLKDLKLTNYLETIITNEHLFAINNIIRQSKIKPKLIGFHGQTILHEPKEFMSVQLGNGYQLYKNLKINLVYDFRKSDLKRLGQGAPLAPIYHKYLIDKLKLQKPAVIINIGGITNLTYWDGMNLIGFDTGPGNNLMDYCIQLTLNKPYDKNGIIASKGQHKPELVSSYLKNDYFKKQFPKSLDRKDLINNEIFKRILNIGFYDSMATLMQITIESINMGLNLLPQKPKNIIIIGGGQNNKNLIYELSQNLKKIVLTGNQIGIPGDFIEAELIAYLAARKLFNLPSTFTSTTGVVRDTVLGKIINDNN